MWNQIGSVCKFSHDELTAKHCYFRCSWSPDVDGIKIFDKDDQGVKHCSFISMFCGLVIFIKNFDPINIRRPWAPEITIFCSEFIMTKTFKPIKTRRHWPPIWFHIFFSQACFGSWPFLFTPGVFWLDIYIATHTVKLIVWLYYVIIQQNFWDVQL